MPLSIGIVGLPNVGKSTLFQAITKKQVDCSNYPFCTIDPNIGVIAVPDERVDKLAKLTNSAKKIYTTIEFIDIAGLVKGANKGEGLGNKFLANIREADAIIYVLRCFKNEKILNVQPSIGVLRDKEILDTEIALKDLATVEKRIQDLEKEIKSGTKETAKELKVLTKAQEFLGQGEILVEKSWDEEEKKILNSYQLLTLKPRLYLLNGSENEVPAEIIETFKKNHWQFLVIDILTELEAADFSSEERISFGLPSESKIDALIKESYKLLELVTFFTTVGDKTQAWTLEKGKTAPQAGGAVHSDFESYFIKAEVINWQELVNAGSFAAARGKGLIRTEGKGYIVKDGDVIEIKSSA
ncbi:MAG: redox-regulated ATPase YchF [Candidatus Nealsonbacteria bacterium CG_4_9_14_3_um_filter_35_11]|uniref:Redox-regulated ATPase YchF n=1 Tax=Candidatus Nealsonbacteria bacterium CG02_land_8_20_14_3_00_34_20 TaxID=1974698 RepID=A0A2M7DBI9_9BACT|nr:MAG: redox-regulated ATPase YchF [Candidatus Nealsonbacteria bacterium CG02_land_8_20_14_3_00_34_20]PIW92751.1 MAG: redox-regulated ATPase YchF [Candidatus Nealsonbacteria bacterium CG_4_8_14_3_um_filter_34_13]PIZ90003.1 MAG: redox-regulated ATPase YchF [Candidatus Nealsonbacteria bacterium CG_4_10_14_0_2_um_filter_35_20]PJA84279.1 MAG: redox-regulated ATPase YchF [Candidatus Nealsonbacteria bacterium CG_4_9_14_3_um_filter_35_11]